jgi:hypothetical protein
VRENTIVEVPAGHLDLLPLAFREFAHHPGEPVEQRADRHHAGIHDRRMQLVGYPAHGTGGVAQVARQGGQLLPRFDLMLDKVEPAFIDHQLADEVHQQVQFLHADADRMFGLIDLLPARGSGRAVVVFLRHFFLSGHCRRRRRLCRFLAPGAFQPGQQPVDLCGIAPRSRDPVADL